MITLLISEEYGREHWLLETDKPGYDALIGRWKTIRNLTCLVPVRWIFPEARLLSDEEFALLDLSAPLKHCHVHEYDDSWLDHAYHDIPYDGDDDTPYPYFWIEGRRYFTGLPEEAHLSAEALRQAIDNGLPETLPEPAPD